MKISHYISPSVMESGAVMFSMLVSEKYGLLKKVIEVDFMLHPGGEIELREVDKRYYDEYGYELLGNCSNMMREEAIAKALLSDNGELSRIANEWVREHADEIRDEMEGVE